MPEHRQRMPYCDSCRHRGEDHNWRVPPCFECGSAAMRVLGSATGGPFLDVKGWGVLPYPTRPEL
jgi:hypothetical protein